MDRTKRTRESGYERYIFVNEDAAKKAEKILKSKFKSMKTKTSRFGALFCHERGSAELHPIVVNVVLACGGVTET